MTGTEGLEQLSLDQSIEVQILCPQLTKTLARVRVFFIEKFEPPEGDAVLCPQDRGSVRQKPEIRKPGEDA